MGWKSVQRFAPVGLIVFFLGGSHVLAAQGFGLADSPSPMYQIDEQHSGQSEFEILGEEPELLWQDEVNPCPGAGITEISIDGSGRLIFAAGSCLMAYDPHDRGIDWTYPFGSLGTPLIDSEGSIYLGQGNIFYAFSADGQVMWTADMGGPIITGFGGAVIGGNGDIYFNHNGLYSFTSDGVFNWVYPAGTITRSSPAIDSAGNIYDTVSNLKSFEPDGTLRWTTGFFNPLWSLSIGPDDTIYAPGCAGKLYALDSTDGSILWEYTIPDPPPADCPDMFGPSIAPDGTLIFGYRVFNEGVYAVNPDGTPKWSFNTGSGLRAPIKVDAGGKAFFCLIDGRCIVLDPEGQVLWEYQFPPSVYDTEVSSLTSLYPVSSQLFYAYDTEWRLNAFTSPSLVPHLFTDTEELVFTAESWDPTPIVAQVAFTSTVTPMNWTASVTNPDWIELSSVQGGTPETLTITIHPGDLPPGTYFDVLRIIPDDLLTTWMEPVTLITTEDMKEDWIEIPIRLSVGTAFNYLPMINPDFQYSLYFFSSWPNGDYLQTVNERGGDLTRLPFFPWDGGLDWSPDGERIAFVGNVGGTKDLYVIDHDGTNQQQLTFGGESEFEPRWSEDGEWILFTSGDPNYHKEIYKIRPDGSELTLVSGLDIFLFAYWSPDGSMIAATDNFTTWVMNADGSDLTVVADDHFSDKVVGWSPDGSRLLMEVHIYSSTGGEIATIKPDGSGFLNLTQSADVNDNQPRWSPDGSRIAFTSYVDGSYEIFLMKADGSGLTRLTDNAATDRNPQWTPDSTRISYESDRSGKFEVFVADLLGNILFFIESYAEYEYNLTWELTR